MTSLELRNAQIVSEFDRYVMEHPTFAAKIPRGAQIILQLPDDPKFNTWVRRIAKKQLVRALGALRLSITTRPDNHESTKARRRGICALVSCFRRFALS